MATPEFSLPAIQSGKLPPNFCPTSEQERLDTYVAAMFLAAGLIKPPKKGDPGDPGKNGLTPTITYEYFTDYIQVLNPDKIYTFVCPDGVDARSVTVDPAGLEGGNGANRLIIDKVERNTLDGEITVTLNTIPTTALAGTDYKMSFTYYKIIITYTDVNPPPPEPEE